MKADSPFTNVIETEEQLRELIGYPSELVENKTISMLDHRCREFIEKSPFLMIASSDEAGFCDVSPRGDKQSFVEVISEKYLIIPERPGNKRMDTMRNILSNPRLGLIFFIPGLGETLRVNGKAYLITDQELLKNMTVRGKAPLIGIGVEVEECYIHCAKAFKRSGLWNPDTWLDKHALPSAARMIFEHANIPNTSVASIQEGLEESYAKRLY
ncbi:pyridoxamine 5'-phosphate oxidase family protein [Gracilibacillus sp. S3-1-1]|uniref:Pyridoxamine 5'-phosphate oxidase family protein n=1 Tax=Gracilibacillus pellucidus TaxID=3095368 RepID=A0ACC6M6B0_9BACI|nr:pyridoxamine 5'-phosphate oxidase family protein [Gracilibacillus sp. S3-1-1]MDX8046460.1 pyridoxamine 5'-phosphate oxidase family protein [Gracilibacillus sp. S3-1-1]